MLDPFTLNRLALSRQQDILDAAQREIRLPSLRPALGLIGRLMVTTGERLMSASARPAFAEGISHDDALCEPESC